MKVNKFTKWFVPYHYWHHHHEYCGVNYRGCSPQCPKDIYERSNETIWNGPLNITIYFRRIIRSIANR